MSTMDSKPPPADKASSSDTGVVEEQEPNLLDINETGHVQELERNFSLFSICSVGIVTGNTWAGRRYQN